MSIHAINATIIFILYSNILKGDWRYQRGNQNPYFEQEQTTQWPKEKKYKRTNNDLVAIGWLIYCSLLNVQRSVFQLYYLFCKICKRVDTLHPLQHFRPYAALYILTMAVKITKIVDPSFPSILYSFFYWSICRKSTTFLK
jgi:hypothetical protein